jgi:hypothetical protein
MPGFVPGIHVFLSLLRQEKAWMAGTSPAMTAYFAVAQFISITTPS